MPDLKKFPTLTTFEELPKNQRWDACLDALSYKYTLGFREACQILKCSRDWITKYIKPNCHYIYLGNGIGSSMPDYASRAKAYLGKGDEKDSVWFHRAEFTRLTS